MLRLSLALASLAALAFAGCSSPGGGTADATHLDLVDYKYQPDSTTFKQDQTAHFENKGTVDHTVTIHDPSGHVVHDVVLHPGGIDEFKFPGPGDYHVFCRFHTDMSAAVEVTA